MIKASMSSQEEEDYHPIELEKPMVGRQRSRSTAGRLVVAIAIILLASLGLYMLRLLFLTSFSDHTPDFERQLDLRPAVKYNCGNSTAEARALGCEFEVFSLAWVPKACYDEDLDREFRESRRWVYMTAPQNGIEISEEELRERIGPAYKQYVTREWHLMHCAFTMKKVSKAMRRGGRLPRRSRSWEHIEHCAGLFFFPRPLPEYDTIMSLGFGDC